MSTKNSEPFASTESIDSRYYSEKPNKTVISLSPDYNYKTEQIEQTGKFYAFPKFLIFQLENVSGFDKQKSIESVLTTSTETEVTVKKEKWYSVFIQIFIPFMIAGVGTIGAGIVLGKVQVNVVNLIKKTVTNFLVNVTETCASKVI